MCPFRNDHGLHIPRIRFLIAVYRDTDRSGSVTTPEIDSTLIFLLGLHELNHYDCQICNERFINKVVLD